MQSKVQLVLQESVVSSLLFFHLYACCIRTLCINKILLIIKTDDGKKKKPTFLFFIVRSVQLQFVKKKTDTVRTLTRGTPDWRIIFISFKPLLRAVTFLHEELRS